ncbi:MAG: hypothetical protein ACLR0U_02105 [Enterocloster clostridioformis]
MPGSWIAYANNGAYASHGHAICANCGNVFKDLYRDELGTGWTASPYTPPLPQPAP